MRSVVALIRSGRWITRLGTASTERLDRTRLQQQLSEAEKKYELLSAEYTDVVPLLVPAVGDVPDFPDLGGGSDV